MTITLTQKQYKVMKKEIVRNSATLVGFNYAIFEKCDHFMLLKAIDEVARSDFYLGLSEADKENFLITKIVKYSSYQDFKKLAPYFFSFSRFARANKEKLLNTILEDDEASKGGVAFAGETLTDFLNEIGKAESIPYMYSDEWLEEVNIMLGECGIKTLSL